MWIDYEARSFVPYQPAFQVLPKRAKLQSTLSLEVVIFLILDISCNDMCSDTQGP